MTPCQPCACASPGTVVMLTAIRVLWPGLPMVPTSHFQNVVVTAPADMAVAASGLCNASSDEEAALSMPLNRSQWSFPEGASNDLEATCGQHPLPPPPPCTSALSQNATCSTYPQRVCDACIDHCGISRLSEAAEACAACSCSDSFGYHSCLVDYCTLRDKTAVEACINVHPCHPPPVAPAMPTPPPRPHPVQPIGSRPPPRPLGSCGPQWLPIVEVVAFSSTAFGFYPSAADSSSFLQLYPSPRTSSATISTHLRPFGGPIMPQAVYSQQDRPAVSHVLLVQTPDVHLNSNHFVVLVQLYDEHGSSRVSSSSMTVSATLGVSTMSLTLSGTRGPSGLTRRYYATVPAAWFAAAEPGGTVASVSSQLSGSDTDTSTFVVYGIPTWFAARLTAAGIAAYMTSDTGGTTPAETMRAGDTFYLQLYGHTGGYAMSAFEVRLEEDPAVCQLVPTSGSMSPTYQGTLLGAPSGGYRNELLERFQDLEDSSLYFTKVRQQSRPPPIESPS
jgi:hypothetical protein